MFLFTMTKPGLRQAGALALCGVCLAGAITAAVHFTGGTVTAGADAEPGIETTQDIAAFFTGHGFEVDLATAAVDKVKIPKTWDDSFTAFDQVVGESGMTLADYKGKTVEKWTVLCPALSDGETDCYCVLLVYKAQAIGAYLLEKPSGEVRWFCFVDICSCTVKQEVSHHEKDSQRRRLRHGEHDGRKKGVARCIRRSRRL